jgi:phosphoribosylformylglycinamidine synthase
MSKSLLFTQLKTASNNLFKREDTLSVRIYNGCQLFMELELINPEHKVQGKMLHNDSHKHESIFTKVTVQENKSVMLSTLSGSKLGVWVSHGEGKLNLPLAAENYNIVGKYSYEGYPANPNKSDYNTAMLCDATGHHLVMMPHIERSNCQWNRANYLAGRNDEVSSLARSFCECKKMDR